MRNSNVRLATYAYDALGNPLSYYNGSNYTFTWTCSELATAAKSSSSYTFVYNSGGLRVQKTVNGVVHKYYYSGDQLLAEEWGNNLIIFLYDANGAPVGMKYRTASYASGTFDTYWYERNLQGDIVAIFGDDSTKYATYRYDAWGNHTVTYYNGGSSIIPITNNPLRYRGYYYDTDLGLYYLQTRYYDSNTGRFISPDAPENLGADQTLVSYNLYAYCSNNPVMYTDPSGESLLDAVVGAVVNLAVTFIAAKVTGQEYTIVDAGVALASGALNAIPIIGPFLAGGLSGGYASYVVLENGATPSESLAVGVATGLATTLSIANLSGWLDPFGTPKSVGLTMLNATLDLVFGSGYNLLAAGFAKTTLNRVKNAR